MRPTPMLRKRTRLRRRFLAEQGSVARHRASAIEPTRFSARYFDSEFRTELVEISRERCAELQSVSVDGMIEFELPGVQSLSIEPETLSIGGREFVTLGQSKKEVFAQSVHLVSYDGESSVLAMDPNLVQPAGQRLGLEQTVVMASCDETEKRTGRLSFSVRDDTDCLADLRVPLRSEGGVDDKLLFFGPAMDDGEVALGRLALLELFGHLTGRLPALSKDEHSTRFAIESMDDADSGPIESLAPFRKEDREESVVEVAAGRMNGKVSRLVDREQMLIFEDDSDVASDVWLDDLFRVVLDHRADANELGGSADLAIDPNPPGFDDLHPLRSGPIGVA